MLYRRNFVKKIMTINGLAGLPMIIWLIKKTGVCLSHESDSVKPEKSRFRMHCPSVLNNLYAIVMIKIIANLPTSSFKHDLFLARVFFKYFKHIHITSGVIDKQVYFEKLKFPEILFDF
jgi:hypothetical protein